jgi:DNA-binding response OmpR family regulator
MHAPAPAFAGRYIVVADENRAVVSLVIETLLRDGHAVFQAYDGLSALQLALNLKVCDLVITNTRVGGRPAIDLIHELRGHSPELAVLYLAKPGHARPGLADQLPPGVRILAEPFTADELRAAVRPFFLPKLKVSRGTPRSPAPRRKRL